MQKSLSGKPCRAVSRINLSEEDYVQVEDHESEMGDDDEIPVEMTRGYAFSHPQ